MGCHAPQKGVLNICIDLAACAQKEMDYLLSLGHRRCALLGGESGDALPLSREAGFDAFLKQRPSRMWGMRVPEQCTPEGGRRAMARVLAMPRPDWPTAVICANDLVALGAVREAKRQGVPVPRHMSVMGCDNTYLAEYMEPALTTVNINAPGIGRAAVERLARQAETGEAAEDLIIQGELVVRSSCAPCEGGGSNG